MRILSQFIVCAIALLVVTSSAAAVDASRWDIDQDGRLSRSEFYSGFDRTGVFDEWDANHDGLLSQAEIEAGLGPRKQLFRERFSYAEGKWAKGYETRMTRDEFYAGLFATYAGPESAFVEPAEFSRLAEDVGEKGFWGVPFHDWQIGRD